MDIDDLWRELIHDGDPAPTPFDPATLADLPQPAARWLARVVPAGAPLRQVVELEMVGRIRLGSRWMPFTARQVLRAGVGFVWRPVVGGRLLRFTGADLLGPDGARMEFRFHGLIPVATGSGPDVARSAAGRLAAETVAWLPTAVVPQAGATWSPVDHERAVVAVPTPSGPVDVTVAIDDDGRLASLTLERWKDSAEPPSLQPFGGDMADQVSTGDGVRIAGAGTVGWDHGTPAWDEGRFFEFEVTGTGP